MFTALESALGKFDIKAERQMRHSSDAPHMYLRKLEHASEVNSFILRMAWSAFAWNPDRICIAQAMADSIHSQLDPNHPIDGLDKLKEKAIGFADYGDPDNIE